FNEFTLTYRTGDIVSPHIPTTEPLQLEIDHFLDCAMGKQRPRTDGYSGLRVVRVLEAIERSEKHGNRLEPVHVPVAAARAAKAARPVSIPAGRGTRG